MKPVRVEVIAPLLDRQALCFSCEIIAAGVGLNRRLVEGEEAYPADWQADFERLSAWVAELAERYGDQIQIRWIDPGSFLGLFKGLRYWIRRYPTFIIEGRHKIVGWDRAGLETVLNTYALPGA